MMWTRMDLKFMGRGAIRKNYGASVLVAFLEALTITLLASMEVNRQYGIELPFGIGISVSSGALLLEIFVGNLFELGAARFFVENQEYNAPASKILFGFQNGHYLNSVGILFLRDLKIVLWTFLFVLPGIVKSYEYRMIPYILAEQPDISSTDAFAISREMMNGQKFEAFCLDLSFLGWYLLNAFTCGLTGLLWTNPYRAATNAELYAVLRNNWIARQNGQGF